MAAKRRSAKKGKKTSHGVMKMLKSINTKVTRIDHHVNPIGFKKRKAHKKALARVLAGGDYEE